MMKFAEFFAGVGLVREGLAADGWHCAWANDIDADKQATYTANFGGDDFILEDIWNIAHDPPQVPDDIFLYTASFPCTDLSVAGDRAGLAGKESGTLNALLHILQQKRQTGMSPKVVLLENVKGFLTSNKGGDIAQTVRTFNELGYVVDIVELDATLFTPQSRQRVFIIAVESSLAYYTMHLKKKENILDSWWMRFHQFPTLRSNKVGEIIRKSPELDWGLFDIIPPMNRTLTLSDMIESIGEDSPLWWDTDKQQYLYEQMSESHQATLQEKIDLPDHFYGTAYRRMRHGRSMAELRSDGIAGCLRTPRGGSSKQILIRAGRGEWRVRLMTPREYARLQGVRDSFHLPDNPNKGYFAMGDAVCVPAIRYLSENILLPSYQAWRVAAEVTRKKTA